MYNGVMYHIKAQVEAEIEVKKSKFIAVLTPVNDIEEVGEVLSAIKKKYPSATHYCTALIVNGIQRSSDDGEPSSPAGLPMLECLRGNKLENVYCIVVRYFGGTLLGTGGLVRAYQQATNEAIKKAIRTIPVTMGIYQLSYPYYLTNKVEQLLQTEAEIMERDYQEEAVITYACEQDLSNRLLEISNGQLVPVKTGEMIREKPVED